MALAYADFLRFKFFMSVIVLRKMFSFDELFIALTDLHHNDFWNLSSDLSKALKHLSLTYHELTARLT